MSDEKMIIPVDVVESQTERNEIEDIKSETQIDEVVKDEVQPSDEAIKESEESYPKGVPFIILTLALMTTVFVAGLDQNILGGSIPCQKMGGW